MGLRDLFRSKPPLPAALIGCWQLVRAEGDLDVGDAVDMEFKADGQLVYAIDAGNRWQLMHMRFHVEGDELVTDQPTAPREERTRYTIGEDGLLVLQQPGSQAWYRRGERRYRFRIGSRRLALLRCCLTSACS